MALTATMLAQLSATLTGTEGLGLGSAEHPLRKAITFADGTGLLQANKIWTAAAQSLAASASASHDLSSVLVDTLGDPVVFTKVKGLFVYAYAANTNDVVVGNDTNHVPIFGAVTHSLAVKPNGVLQVIAPNVAGYTVTAATGDIIKITNSAGGTAVVYDIAVLGA